MLSYRTHYKKAATKKGGVEDATDRRAADQGSTYDALQSQRDENIVELAIVKMSARHWERRDRRFGSVGV